MKKLFLICVLALVIFSCNQSHEKIRSEVLKEISWRTAVKAEYMLVSPIECYSNSRDVYQFPVKSGEWYMVNKSSNCFLLPIIIYEDAPKPDFVENVTHWKKIAIIDTVTTSESRLYQFEGMRSIKKLAILCMAKDYKICPSLNSKGYYCVIAQKK